MKHHIPLYLLVLFIAGSCKKVPQQTIEDKVLFSVAGEPVTAEEFIYVYEKNNFNNDSIYTEDDVKDYLDLFINFKLKVKQAEAEGFDTTTAFTKEFSQYKSQLLMPYLSKSKAIDKLVREAYERSKYLVHASHILIKAEENASPEDTLKAYNKAQEIKQKAQDGTDFGTLARKYSDDPSAAQNGGDLGYFSAFRMVYPFESAAYNTPVGSISDIVRTQFGYHILKVHDKKPIKGSAKVAHIMIGFKNRDSVDARNMAFELYDQLIAGADWDKLCTEFSDDVRSKNRGGVLSTVKHGQLPPQLSNFENTIFNLDSSDQISDPVKTPYGWHIVKLIEKTPPQPFEEVKDNLESKVKQDNRAQHTKKQVIENLKQKSGFKENSKSFELIEENIDSSLIDGKWSKPSLANNNDTLFTVSDKNYTISEFVKFIGKEQRRRGRITPHDYLKELYDDFVENSLIDFEEVQIKQENKDYRMLVKEYREGILLFEMMDKYVWSKANSDSTGLREYFDDHKENYMWEERAKATILNSTSYKVLAEAEQRLKQETLYTLKADTTSASDSLSADIKQIIKKYSDSSGNIDEAVLNILFDKNVSDEFIQDIVKEFDAQGIAKNKVVTSRELSSDNIIFQLNSRSNEALEKLYNTSSTLTLQVEEGKFEKGDKEIFKQIEWKAGTYTFDQNGRKYLVYISDIIPPKPKKLNETRGKVISDYQEQMENEWIASLKVTYSVQVNQNVLNEIIDHFEK